MQLSMSSDVTICALPMEKQALSFMATSKRKTEVYPNDMSAANHCYKNPEFEQRKTSHEHRK